MASQRTAAHALALLYACLIVYASLYPFEGWRVQGLAPWSFLWAPMPRYWTGFDVVSNVLGYGPLGFLVSLALRRRRPRWPAIALTSVLALLLSLGMESLQMLLPARVPSNVDLALNVVGAWGGAVLARVMEAGGWLDHWSRFRDRWFEPESSEVLVLLSTWPVALLFPVAVPFGLGQVYERAEAALLLWLSDTPWIDWMPLREVELQPLLPVSEWLCIAMGLALPGLLAFSVLRTVRQRMVVSVLGPALGLGASTLSAALTYGPSHAWDWVSSEVLVGGVLAALALVVMWGRSARTCLVVSLALLVCQLTLLNQASADVYFAQTLQHWEQGRFIRFHGLIQWLGWLWPYALLWHLVRRLSRPWGVV